jgi:hypothetical protein
MWRVREIAETRDGAAARARRRSPAYADVVAAGRSARSAGAVMVSRARSLRCRRRRHEEWLSDVARPKKPKKAQKRAFDREIERSIGTPARTHREIVRAWRIVPGSKTESRALLVCDFLTNEICTFFFRAAGFPKQLRLCSRRTRQQPSSAW